MAPYTFSVPTNALPPGLNLDSSSGTISGTPTQSGTYTFTVTVTDSGNPAQTGTETMTLTVVSPLTVGTTSLPGGLTGNAYSQTLAASGGFGADTWSVTSGSLPPGLTLASSSGAISGTPTATGTHDFTVQVTDSGSPQMSATEPLSITVAAPLAITTASLPNALTGQSYSQTLVASGGTGTLFWSGDPTTWPPGLTIDGSGNITGTPTQTGTYTFTESVSDSGAQYSLFQQTSKTFTINVVAPLTISVPSASTSGCAAGLPELSGEPEAPGEAPRVVIDLGTQCWSVLPGWDFSQVTTSPYNQLFSASGGNSSYTWTILPGDAFLFTDPNSHVNGPHLSQQLLIAPVPPPGLQLCTQTSLLCTGGDISQSSVITTPPTNGGYAFGLQVTDTSGQTAIVQVEITVTNGTNPLSVVTSSDPLPDAIPGAAYSTHLLSDVSGGTPPYSYSVIGGALPPGLSMDSTGLISGTVDPNAATGSYYFEVRGSDSSSPPQSGTFSSSITVTEPDGSGGISCIVGCGF